ncbi:MAG: 2,3-bisphosphoglycerate-independent phosphoglycerate mutase 1 [Methanosaeta sp. PtaB.Bin039]|nr:MAG: 2,3-bisphosphoglycerate-independent phosphoglycerate mutase 1 [Methanosaeta sp. PtaB.Bin039]
MNGSHMKFAILLGDGMADQALPELSGRTPLQAASTGSMDALAARGRLGMATTVPPGFPAGSDVANLSVMGYDPRRYYSGRAPLEAAAMGVPLKDGDIAFRCNLVTVQDGRMADYSAGHISSAEGAEIIRSLRHLVPGERLYPGVSYRHLAVLEDGAKAKCTPPHDITGQPFRKFLPRGPGGEILKDIMDRAAPILASHPVNSRRVSEGKRPANMIWLWGQGPAPFMPRFRQLYGRDGAVISAVDLLKGIGIYAGMEVVDVPGATGTIDTDYEGKVEGACRALHNVDVVYLHVEAPDEAGHAGDLDQKIEAIELFDCRVVGPMVEALEASGHPWRVLLMPDHPTPIPLRTHTAEPVPFLMAGEGIAPDRCRSFDEVAAKDGGFGLVEGFELMGRMLGRHD